MAEVVNKYGTRYIEVEDWLWAVYEERGMFCVDSAVRVAEHKLQTFLDMASGLELVEDFEMVSKFFVGGVGRCRRWLTV